MKFSSVLLYSALALASPLRHNQPDHSPTPELEVFLTAVTNALTDCRENQVGYAVAYAEARELVQHTLRHKILNDLAIEWFANTHNHKWTTSSYPDFVRRCIAQFKAYQKEKEYIEARKCADKMKARYDFIQAEKACAEKNAAFYKTQHDAINALLHDQQCKIHEGLIETALKEMRCRLHIWRGSVCKGISDSDMNDSGFHFNNPPGPIHHDTPPSPNHQDTPPNVPDPFGKDSNDQAANHFLDGISNGLVAARTSSQVNQNVPKEVGNLMQYCFSDSLIKPLFVSMFAGARSEWKNGHDFPGFISKVVDSFNKYRDSDNYIFASRLVQKSHQLYSHDKAIKNIEANNAKYLVYIRAGMARIQNNPGLQAALDKGVNAVHKLQCDLQMLNGDLCHR